MKNFFKKILGRKTCCETCQAIGQVIAEIYKDLHVIKEELSKDSLVEAIQTAAFQGQLKKDGEKN